MQLKQWMIGLLAALALVACGAPSGQTVARVENVTLTRQDLDQRIDRILAALQKQPQAGAPTPSRLDVEKELVDGTNGFINQNLLLSIAKQKGLTVTDKEIDALIAQFRAQVTQNGTQSFDEVVQGALGLPGGDSSDFRKFASFFVARQKLAETLVTTDTVKAQVTQQVQAQAAQQVREFHSAHILFAAGNPQGGTTPTDAEFAAALEKSNKALERLKGGEDFAALAKELSDDPGSKDKGGEYDWTREGSFVPEYEQAVFNGLKPGEYTTTPVKSQFGYHIIKLLEPTREVPAMSPDQVQQAIDQQVGQALQQERGAALDKLLADERAKAQKDGRLVVPTYPEPTPAPQAQPQPQPTSAP